MGSKLEMLDPAQTGSLAQALLTGLRQRIVGQDEAIETVVQAYQTYLAGMSTRLRPIANLLFLGPTGSGKTRLVEATAESLAGDSRAVIKVDCGEFQHSHEIAKLIGSPPGYIGHRETHSILSQEALNQYQKESLKVSFVLFDEIEKASDALWNLLLGILDKATLTLGDNRRVDFSQAMIFMTGNVGADSIGSILHPGMGFAAAEAERQQADELGGKVADKIAQAGLEAARRKFTPEFMNRIDRTVVFRPLGPRELRRILSLELEAVQERILGTSNTQPFLFHVTEAARFYLLQEGSDLKYGARHLKRAIERHLVYPLSNLMVTQQLRSGDVVWVDLDVGGQTLQFWKESSWKQAAVTPNWPSAATRTNDSTAPTNSVAEPRRWLRARNVKQ
jgi:ATP-dependent Clp protease ATP-binding subunit ClpB